VRLYYLFSFEPLTNQVGYLVRLSAVATWPAIILGVVALVVTIMARSRARQTTNTAANYNRSGGAAYEEKVVGDKASV
jgi:hypothetical protein